MAYWISAFAIGLVTVIGYAGGLIGAIIAVAAFAVTLFMLWSYKLGFDGAWTSFALDRYTAPLLEGSNWDRFTAIFADREKLAKACTVTVVLIALWLAAPTYQVILALAAVVAWYVYEIKRANKGIAKTSGPTTLELPVSKEEPVYPVAEESINEGARVN
jgi:hypothetical protein